jgi:hypothetical protein
MDLAIQELVADVLAMVLAIACLAFMVVNVKAIRKNPKSPFRFFWMVQCIPLGYGTCEFANAALTHESIGKIDGRAAVLMIIVIALAERIALVRSRNSCD